MGKQITIVGTGLMGSAIARHWAICGHSVTAWNRTPDRAAPLGKTGITIEPDLRAALRGGEVAFLIVANYDVGRELLNSMAHILKGKVLINGMTGTAAEARRMSEFMHLHGGSYLDAGIMCYPADIGSVGGLITYGGDHHAWQAHEHTLVQLGGACRYLGTDPALPNITDSAMAGAFYNVALGGFLEAMSFAATAGLSAETLTPIAIHMMGLLARLLRDEATPAIDNGAYGTDQATLDVYVEAVRRWRSDMLDAGQRASLMTANLHNLELARAAGHGAKSIYTQFLTSSAARAR